MEDTLLQKEEEVTLEFPAEEPPLPSNFLQADEKYIKGGIRDRQSPSMEQSQPTNFPIVHNRNNPHHPDDNRGQHHDAFVQNQLLREEVDLLRQRQLKDSGRIDALEQLVARLTASDSLYLLRVEQERVQMANAKLSELKKSMEYLENQYLEELAKMRAKISLLEEQLSVPSPMTNVDSSSHNPSSMLFSHSLTPHSTFSLFHQPKSLPSHHYSHNHTIDSSHHNHNSSINSNNVISHEHPAAPNRVSSSPSMALREANQADPILLRASKLFPRNEGTSLPSPSNPTQRRPTSAHKPSSSSRNSSSPSMRPTTSHHPARDIGSAFSNNVPQSNYATGPVNNSSPNAVSLPKPHWGSSVFGPDLMIAGEEFLYSTLDKDKPLSQLERNWNKSNGSRVS